MNKKSFLMFILIVLLIISCKTPTEKLLKRYLKIKSTQLLKRVLIFKYKKQMFLI